MSSSNLGADEIKEALRLGAAAGKSKEEVFKRLAMKQGYGAYLPAEGPDVDEDLSVQPGTQPQPPMQPSIAETAQGRLNALSATPPAPSLGQPLPNAPVAAGFPYTPTGTEEPLFTPKQARQILAGGASMAAAPFTAGMSLLPAAATETALVGGADLGLQGLRKAMDPSYDVKPMESLEIGATAGGTTMASRTAFDILSRLGGVAPQFTRYFRNPKNIGRLNRTLGEPAKQAEFALGERIKQAVQDWTSTKTGSRIAKEAMIEQATTAGKKISANPIIDALEDVKLQSPKTPVGEKLNGEISRIQDQFKAARTLTPPANVGNTYQPTTPRKIRSARQDLTPKEVDEFLTKELDNRIYKLSGSPKNQALAEALANARPAVRKALLGSLPKEAAELTAQTEKELIQRAAVKKAIQPQMVSLETKIRNLFKPGHAAELEALKHVSKEVGIPFDEEAFKLAQQRSFSPDQRLATKGLDAIMELVRGAIARPVLKAAAPFQSLVSPGAAAAAATFEEDSREPKRIRPAAR